MNRLFTKDWVSTEKFASRWSLTVYLNVVVSIATASAFVGISFRTHQTRSSKAVLCSVETPDVVLNTVRSKHVCLLLCQGDSRCLNVNWKEPSTCEMYSYYAGVLGNVKSCTYYGQGEKFISSSTFDFPNAINTLQVARKTLRPSSWLPVKRQ